MVKPQRPELEPPFPGALTVTDAARIVQKTRQAITYAVRAGALKAIKEDGVRGRMWIDILDLRETFPPHTRHGNLKRRVFRLSNAQQDEVLGFTPSVNGVTRRPTPIENIRETNE